MSIRGVNGKDLDVSSEVVRVNNFYGNGTRRESLRLSRAKDYGAKRVVAAAQRYRPVSKEAFRQIAPSRMSGPSYEAYNSETGGMGMRGRVKASRESMEGTRPDAAFDEVTGVSLVEESSAEYYNAPEDYEAGVGDYVEVEGGEPGDYTPYEEVGDYIEVREEKPGYYEPYVVEGMGQAYTGPQELWRQALSDFSKDIRGFSLFTTGSQELRAYNKAMHVVTTGRTAFAGHPQIQAGINVIASELARWKKDRAWAITRAPGTVNTKTVSKIRTRMINATNYARVAVNLSSVSTMPVVPSFPIPQQIQQEAPGAATPPGVVPMPIPVIVDEPTWFEKNKTMVVVGGALAVLGMGYYFYKKG